MDKSFGSFQALGLEKNILNGLNRMGYKVPTPVQRKGLPLALGGTDIVCMARTGSGKTCVFLLPMIQKLKSHSVATVGNSNLRGLVLSPTRELCMQTFKFAKDMAKFTDLRIITIIGGDPIEGQFEALASNPDVIVATPGRLMHHIREISTFKLKFIEYLVFDEADRLFEMGFAEQLNEIVRECPNERQTLLFSATMPSQLIQFSRAGLREPQFVRLDTDVKMSEELRLAFFTLRSNEKLSALLYIVRNIIPDDQLTILFVATRHHSEMIHAVLNDIGVSSTLIYGTMEQELREHNLRSFRNGQVQYLIVTDLAARGIDVPLLNNVINYHFPATPKLYVHRSGRAARQGRIGFSFSLIEPDEMAYMVDVHTFLGKEVDTSYSSESSDEKIKETEKYTLQTMQPNWVHTGLIPQDVVDEETDYVKRLIARDDNIRTLWRISENGMKQYKRTRTEATKQGVRKAKQLSKSKAIKDIHPLIVGCDPERCTKKVVEKAEFIRTLQAFRPSQTVLETGIGTGSSASLATVSNGGNLLKNKKNLKGIEIMREMRNMNSTMLDKNRQQGTTSNKEPEDELEANPLDESYLDDRNDISVDEYYHSDGDSSGEENTSDKNQGSKILEQKSSEKGKRISRAEKKKLKKKGLSSEEIQQIVARKKLANTNTNVAIDTVTELSSESTEKTFRDKYYMSYGNEDSHLEFAEQSLQPRAGLRSSEAQSASLLENALLDINPDEAMELNNKRRITRWDAKKKNFVKQSLGEISNQGGSSKRIRTESGVILSKSSKPVGEMYSKWKKKTHLEIGGSEERKDSHMRPNMKINRNVKDELRNMDEIRKMQKTRDKLKLKNMSKDKRKKVEAKAKKAKKSSKSQKGPTSGKSRLIVRM